MFKKGSNYSRNDVSKITLGTDKPKGGDWDTGYVRVNDDLLMFMNIGVSGVTGHDFNNSYDTESELITWFGKPNTHSNQPLMKRIINGSINCHFFARWDNKLTDFVYLGIGNVISFEDGSEGKNSLGKVVPTIKFVISCKDAPNIIIDEENKSINSTFALEKHLEEFIVDNWNNISLGKNYYRYEKEVEGKRKKFRTDTGEIDIFAKSKDEKEFLIIELKKGRASDKVIGQIQNYIGFVKEELANNGEIVKGIIIALEDDQRIRRALKVTNNIEFYRYKINFNLEKVISS